MDRRYDFFVQIIVSGERILALPIKEFRIKLDCYSVIVKYNTSLQVFRFLLRTPIIIRIINATGATAWNVG